MPFFGSCLPAVFLLSAGFAALAGLAAAGAGFLAPLAGALAPAPGAFAAAGALAAAGVLLAAGLAALPAADLADVEAFSDAGLDAAGFSGFLALGSENKK